MVTSKSALQPAFDMGGGNKAKNKAKRRLYRAPTRRDVERQALKQSGAWEFAKRDKPQPRDIDRIVKAAGYGPGITRGLSARELQQFEADLAFLGILPGRTAGTLPERLVAKYLWGKGLPYEGMGYQARLSQGWAFQLPVLGGRAGAGGGSVLDIAISAKASISGKIVGVRANGYYWHNMPGIPAKDARQKTALEKAGFQVLDIWDYDILVPGILDVNMRSVLR